MLTALINGRVMTDRGAAENCAVLIANGRIIGLVAQNDAPGSPADSTQEPNSSPIMYFSRLKTAVIRLPPE